MDKYLCVYALGDIFSWVGQNFSRDTLGLVISWNCGDTLGMFGMGFLTGWVRIFCAILGLGASTGYMRIVSVTCWGFHLDVRSYY